MWKQFSLESQNTGGLLQRAMFTCMHTVLLSVLYSIIVASLDLTMCPVECLFLLLPFSKGPKYC